MEELKGWEKWGRVGGGTFCELGAGALTTCTGLGGGSDDRGCMSGNGHGEPPEESDEVI